MKLVNNSDAKTSSPVKSVQIIFLSIFSACMYGVVHDQVTVRLCSEYFTIAHPPLFHTSSPTLLALCWGIAATAGIGAVLGVILARVSQSRGSAPYSVSRLARSVLFLLAIMGISAFIAGVIGYQLSRRGFIFIPAGLIEGLPAQQHDRFMAVWFAHGASYFVGLAGGALLCFRVWQVRGRPSVIALFPQTIAAAIRTIIIVILAAFIAWIRFFEP